MNDENMITFLLVVLAIFAVCGFAIFVIWVLT